MSIALWSGLAARASAQALRARATQGESLAVLVASPFLWQVGREPTLRPRDSAALGAVAARLLAAGHVAISGELLAQPIVAMRGRGSAPIDDILHAILARLALHCDACLRVGGPSPAADAAARLFAERGLPVFHRLADVPGCG
jgi:hypothetical protein